MHAEKQTHMQIGIYGKNRLKKHSRLKFIGLCGKSHGQTQDQYVELILSLWVGDTEIDLPVTNLLTPTKQ